MVLSTRQHLIPKGKRDFVNWLQKERAVFCFLAILVNGLTETSQKSFSLWDWMSRKVIFIRAPWRRLISWKPRLQAVRLHIIGAHGLINALYEVGIPFNDVNPEYVVVGETTGYNYEMIIKATELINKGAVSLLAPLAI